MHTTGFDSHLERYLGSHFAREDKHGQTMEGLRFQGVKVIYVTTPKDSVVGKKTHKRWKKPHKMAFGSHFWGCGVFF